MKGYLMYAILFVIIAIAVFTITGEERTYWGGRDIPLCGSFLMLTLVAYGTPAYIFLAALTWISRKLNIEKLKDVMYELDAMFSLPILPISYGLSKLYCVVRGIELKEDMKEIELMMSNIIGIGVLIAFQMRLIVELYGVMLVFSLILAAGALLLERTRK